jgi:predicted ATPase
MPDEEDYRVEETLSAPDMLAVNTLGQFAKHPRVSALRNFITGWYLSYLSADNTRSVPEAGAQERLSATGDNLPNVIQYLQERYPDRLKEILETLARRVPRLERVDSSFLADGRLLLQVKDAPFERPILAKYASDGTLKMLAYLTVLYDPDPPPLIGIEEPENQLHPRLLPELAEECRLAAAQSQLMVTTHSPFFVNGLRPEEVWVLYRRPNGYTQARRASDMLGIEEFMDQGALLGHLWIEGHFDVGDPLSLDREPSLPDLHD